MAERSMTLPDLIPAQYAAADAVTVAGDQTADWRPGVRVAAWCGADGWRYGTVTTASYDAAAGVTTITITPDAGPVTANLAGILIGTGTPASLANHTHSGPADGGVITVPVIGLANDSVPQRSNITQVDGDLWITANAEYVDNAWHRIDCSRAAYALVLQGCNNFPYESEQGAALWVAKPGDNPIGTAYGAIGSWELGWDVTAYRDLVIGGYGMEVDGQGTSPFGRFVHTRVGESILTGILTNWYNDLSARDAASSAGWFIGRQDDAFVIKRTAPLSSTWLTLLSVDADGRMSSPLLGAADGVVSDATTALKGKLRLATAAEAQIGTDTATAVSPAALASVLATWVPTLLTVDTSIVGVACVAAGGDGGTWAWVDSAGNAVTPVTGYFNAHPVFGGIVDVTIDGQAMVKIPQFYIKRTVLTVGPYSGKEAWFISDHQATGFHLHPAFYNSGEEIDQIYVGKYQASSSDGTKLESLPGVLPKVSTTLTAFWTLATSRNVSGVTGFMLWSIYQWSAIQWLYLIENATMNSQTKTGQGRVSQSSAANVDADDVAQATYRGIVGLWGNVHQWMDGLKTDGIQICLWDTLGNKSWVATGQKRTATAATAIYPLTFMDQSDNDTYDFANVFVGDTGPTTNSGATAPDYQWFNETAANFPVVGGYWGAGSDAGLWSVICYNGAPSSGTYIGARLAKV